MTASRDPDRLIHAFLLEGEDQLHDQVYDAVRAEIEQKRQRAGLGPWRTLAMNKFVAIGLGAAAVVVVLLIGSNLLGGSGPPPGGAPSASAEPSEAAAPSVEPSAPADGKAFPSDGPLAVGRHAMILEGVPLSIEVLNLGWTSQEGNSLWRDSSFILFWTGGTGGTPDRVYTDPCAGIQGPVIGPDIAALAAAVAAVPGTDLVAGPSDLTIGGRPAKHVVLTIREDVDCAPEEMFLWGNEAGGLYPEALGDQIRVWIIDTGDAVVWIDADTPLGSTAVDQEMQQIVESIQFE